MWVYGDRSRRLDPRAALDALEGEAAALAQAPAGLDRHARLAGGLIAAGGLAQGLADAAFEARGGLDGRGEAGDAAQALTMAFAHGLVGSWRSGFALAAPIERRLVQKLRAVLPSGPVEVKTCEGYAFYAVYPELYAEAAAGLGASVRVVGLRSIGASLAAAAAAGCGAPPPLTLRPQGDPFAREIRVDAALTAELSAPAAGGWAVVDEGPGLSGSSFAAAGALLEAHGARAEDVVFLPSHDGAPGDAAPAPRRAWWAGARKRRVEFDDAIAPRLAVWAEPLVGRAVAPLEDLCAGRWRSHVPPALATAPAWPAQERRKYRLTTDAGAFLLKFAGLGAEGEAKLARSRALHAAGWAAEPVGLVHGFLVERWIDAAPLDAVRGGAGVVGQLARYLAFRARLAAPEPGAGSEELRAMMIRNFSLAGLPDAAETARRLPSGVAGPPAAIDGRLHGWEWRVADGARLLKTDALDHAQAHDLIGPQDLAWDVAGALNEFALDPEAAERLRAALEQATGAPLDPRRIAFQALAYLAFQLGWWTLAGSPEAARYKDLARRWTPA